MSDLAKAKQLLNDNDFTCVLVKGDEVVSSTKSGVAPLLDFIADGKNLSGFAAADKIVGKAAAILYAYMKVSAVYAKVLSVSAQEVFLRFGIRCQYGELTQKIINRRGDGTCPMELAVENIDEPKDALLAIKNKAEALKNGNGAK